VLYDFYVLVLVLDREVLMEEFEIYRGYKRPSSNTMEVVIQKDGRAITFIEGAFQNLGSPKEVQLGYNPKKRTISISSANEQTREPIPVHKQGKRYSISTGAFFHEHKIKISRANCYELIFTNNGLATIDPYRPSGPAFTVPRKSSKAPRDGIVGLLEKAMQTAKEKGTSLMVTLEIVGRVYS